MRGPRSKETGIARNCGFLDGAQQACRRDLADVQFTVKVLIVALAERNEIGINIEVVAFDADVTSIMARPRGWSGRPDVMRDFFAIVLSFPLGVS